MDNIERVNFGTVYQVQADFNDDLLKLVEKYDGQMSLAQFIGVMEIFKHELLCSSKL